MLKAFEDLGDKVNNATSPSFIVALHPCQIVQNLLDIYMSDFFIILCFSCNDSIMLPKEEILTILLYIR